MKTGFFEQKYNFICYSDQHISFEKEFNIVLLISNNSDNKSQGRISHGIDFLKMILLKKQLI